MPVPDPEDLRRALRDEADAASPPPIDLDAALESSRANRRRRRTALVGTAAAVLLVAAAGGTALTVGLGVQQSATTTADAPLEESESFADASDPADGAGVAPADEPQQAEAALVPVDRLNPCGAPPLGATPVEATGLAITVVLQGALAPGGSANAVVSITNVGDASYTGELLTGPAVTLSDSATLWHTSGLQSARTPLELAPGASTAFVAEVRAVRCSPEDEADRMLPAELPAIPAGAYWLSAAVALADPAAPLGVPLVSPRIEVAVG